MKVAAILGVKNEVEMIEASIRHLYNIGVDQILVTDYYSNDGTEKILENIQSDTLAVLKIDEAENLDQTMWGEREADIAKAMKADWVIFLDADEFWLPATESIKTTLNDISADVLIVPRYNMPLVMGEMLLIPTMNIEHYPEIYLYAKRPVGNFQKMLSEDANMAWSSGVPMPKVAVRPGNIKQLAAGHHMATPYDPERCNTVIASNMVIAHLPFTTLRRFECKVSSISDTLNTQSSYHIGNTAWHWRRWVEMADNGGLREEFDRQVITKQQFASLHGDGAIRSVTELIGAIK